MKQEEIQTKQDIIREGIARVMLRGFLKEKGWDNLFESDRQLALKGADPIIEYLHSQGIRLPDGSGLIKELGYEAVEPLI